MTLPSFRMILLLAFVPFAACPLNGNEEEVYKEDPLIVISGETGSGKKVSVFLKHLSYGSSQPLVFAAIVVDLPTGKRKTLHLAGSGRDLPEGLKSPIAAEDGIADLAWSSFDKEGVPHLILCLSSNRAMMPNATLDIRFVGPEGGKTGIKNGINYLTFSWPDEGIEIELAELKAEFSNAF